MPITENLRQELLNVSYVYAVAAQAGLLPSHTVYDYGIDVMLTHVQTLPDGTTAPCGFHLNFQLKSSINCSLRRDVIVYDLRAKSYNNFATWVGPSPYYLILMRLPADTNQRLLASEDVLELRDCCYWLYIPPGEIIENTRSKRIEIPRANRFTVDAVLEMMERHRNGRQP